MSRPTGEGPDAAVEDQPIDWLYLPRPVTHGLHTLGIRTLGDLMLIGLRQIGQCPPLAGLSQQDWVVLVRMLRRVMPSSPPLRNVHQAPAAGRSLAVLDLPGSARRVLEGYGVTHVGDLGGWSLGDLVALRGIGASAVAAIIRGLAGGLPDAARAGDASRGTPDDENPEQDDLTRHRTGPQQRTRRPTARQG
jgi:hypothetical protein